MLSQNQLTQLRTYLFNHHTQNNDAPKEVLAIAKRVLDTPKLLVNNNEIVLSIAVSLCHSSIDTKKADELIEKFNRIITNEQAQTVDFLLAALSILPKQCLLTENPIEKITVKDPIDIALNCLILPYYTGQAFRHHFIKLILSSPESTQLYLNTIKKLTQNQINEIFKILSERLIVSPKSFDSTYINNLLNVTNLIGFRFSENQQMQLKKASIGFNPIATEASTLPMLHGDLFTHSGKNIDIDWLELKPINTSTLSLIKIITQAKSEWSTFNRAPTNSKKSANITSFPTDTLEKLINELPKETVSPVLWRQLKKIIKPDYNFDELNVWRSDFPVELRTNIAYWLLQQYALEKLPFNEEGTSALLAEAIETLINTMNPFSEIKLMLGGENFLLQANHFIQKLNTLIEHPNVEPLLQSKFKLLRVHCFKVISSIMGNLDLEAEARLKQLGSYHASLIPPFNMYNFRAQLREIYHSKNPWANRTAWDYKSPEERIKTLEKQLAVTLKVPQNLEKFNVKSRCLLKSFLRLSNQDGYEYDTGIDNYISELVTEYDSVVELYINELFEYLDEQSRALIQKIFSAILEKKYVYPHRFVGNGNNLMALITAQKDLEILATSTLERIKKHPHNWATDRLTLSFISNSNIIKNLHSEKLKLDFITGIIDSIPYLSSYKSYYTKACFELIPQDNSEAMKIFNEKVFKLINEKKHEMFKFCFANKAAYNLLNESNKELINQACREHSPEFYALIQHEDTHSILKQFIEVEESNPYRKEVTTRLDQLTLPPIDKMDNVLKQIETIISSKHLLTADFKPCLLAWFFESINTKSLAELQHVNKIILKVLALESPPESPVASCLSSYDKIALPCMQFFGTQDGHLILASLLLDSTSADLIKASTYHFKMHWGSMCLDLDNKACHSSWEQMAKTKSNATANQCLQVLYEMILEQALFNKYSNLYLPSESILNRYFNNDEVGSVSAIQAAHCIVSRPTNDTLISHDAIVIWNNLNKISKKHLENCALHTKEKPKIPPLLINESSRTKTRSCYSFFSCLPNFKKTNNTKKEVPESKCDI